MRCFEESKIRTAPAPGAVIVGEEVWNRLLLYRKIFILLLEMLFGNFSIPIWEESGNY